MLTRPLATSLVRPLARPLVASSIYIPPTIRSIAFIGSSSVERNQAASGSYRFFHNYGFAVHACNRLRQRAMLAYNAAKNTYEFGTAGANSATLLTTRVPEAIAAAPDAAVIYDGMTECADGTATTAAVALARTQAIYDALRAGGIRTIIIMATGPRNAAATGGTGYWARQQALNTLKQAWCSANNIPYYDINASLQNQTTGDWLSGLTSDGIHMNDVSASIAGREVAALLQADTRFILGPSPFTATRIAALRGINPAMTGGTTTATGYVAFAAAGSLTPSKVAATDGGNGWQRLLFSASGRTNTAEFRAPGNTPIALPAGIAPGDLVRMWIDYEIAAGAASWSIEQNLTFNGTGAPAIGFGGGAADTGAALDWPSSMVIVSPVAQIPADATTVRFQSFHRFSIDARIRNWGMEKVTNYQPPAIGS